MKIRALTLIILGGLPICLPACSELEAQHSGEEVSIDAHQVNEHGGSTEQSNQPHGEQHADKSGSEHSEHAAEGHAEHQHKILVTSPLIKDVITTQEYVCQIHSCRHIEVCALEGGYLEDIPVKEGQSVKKGELMFKIQPVLYQAKLDADIAEAQLAEIELQNTDRLFQQRIVAQPEVALAKAKLAKAQAQVKLTRAELGFADIKAPFDGIIDRQIHQLGSLIAEGDMLTTLSDNSVMWVYFNVTEKRYIEYKTSTEEDLKVELVLAGGTKFSQPGVIGAIEADFNNETGNIAFRADFANPDRLLRNGQTGKVLIHRVSKDALVIPQRAKFEILAKEYVFVVGDDGVVRQREITVANELEDIYLIKDGLSVNDKIILEGVRQVRDGDKVTYEFRDPAEVLSNLKNHAE